MQQAWKLLFLDIFWKLIPHYKETLIFWVGRGHFQFSYYYVVFSLLLWPLLKQYIFKYQIYWKSWVMSERKKWGPCAKWSICVRSRLILLIGLIIKLILFSTTHEQIVVSDENIRILRWLKLHTTRCMMMTSFYKLEYHDPVMAFVKLLL